MRSFLERRTFTFCVLTRRIYFIFESARTYIYKKLWFSIASGVDVLYECVLHFSIHKLALYFSTHKSLPLSSYYTHTHVVYGDEESYNFLAAWIYARAQKKKREVYIVAELPGAFQFSPPGYETITAWCRGMCVNIFLGPRVWREELWVYEFEGKADDGMFWKLSYIYASSHRVYILK